MTLEQSDRARVLVHIFSTQSSNCLCVPRTLQMPDSPHSLLKTLPEMILKACLVVTNIKTWCTRLCELL